MKSDPANISAMSIRGDSNCDVSSEDSLSIAWKSLKNLGWISEGLKVGPSPSVPGRHLLQHEDALFFHGGKA